VTEKENDVKHCVSSPEQEKSKRSKEGKKTEARFCKDCRFYDKSKEREFHRKVGSKNDKGERSEIIETRAVCENSKASSYHHLVMAEYSKRQCPVWERGVYVMTEKKQREYKNTLKKQVPAKATV